MPAWQSLCNAPRPTSFGQCCHVHYQAKDSLFVEVRRIIGEMSGSAVVPFTWTPKMYTENGKANFGLFPYPPEDIFSRR